MTNTSINVMTIYYSFNNTNLKGWHNLGDKVTDEWVTVWVNRSIISNVHLHINDKISLLNYMLRNNPKVCNAFLCFCPINEF
jgi:hypothetical protein